jgi:CheY-like chemotaxis protein/DNA-binding XRE family transcriptional regulator
MDTFDLKKQFGAAVKSQRVRLGMSQEELAELADLHRTYVTDVERGSRNLSLVSIHKLAHALGVPIGSLFLGPDISESVPSTSDQKASEQIVDLLVVEDDEKDLDLMLEAFREARVANNINVVRDGAAALDFVFCRRAYAHRRFLPQIMLLDLKLPKLHGLEVLRRIKTDERTRNIHVIVLTISQNDEHIQEALQLGAAAYIAKPVEFRNFSQITPKLSLQWALISPGVQQPSATGAAA